MLTTSEKLNTQCAKCSHRAASHNTKTGKHECFVYGCDCAWFKMPEEKIDDGM